MKNNIRKNGPIFMMITTIFIVVFMTITFSQIGNQKKIERLCVKSTDATLIDYNKTTETRRESTGTSKRRRYRTVTETVYNCQYQYVVDGTKYSYNMKTYNEPSKSILIKYNPDNPKQSCLPVDKNKQITIYIMIAVFIIVFLFIIIILIKNNKRNKYYDNKTNNGI